MNKGLKVVKKEQKKDTKCEWERAKSKRERKKEEIARRVVGLLAKWHRNFLFYFY